MPLNDFFRAGLETPTPAVDLKLDADLAALGPDKSPDMAVRRFQLYVDATERALSVRGIMPDLPPAIEEDYQLVMHGTGDYLGIEIPRSVEAAHYRTELKAASAAFNQRKGSLPSVYDHKPIIVF